MNMAAQPFWLVILGLGITGSIVGAITAAIASALNERSRRRFELRKWRTEFYLRPKLEALRNLHAAMVHSHYEVNMRATRMPQTIQEYREQAERPLMEFFGALGGTPGTARMFPRLAFPRSSWIWSPLFNYPATYFIGARKL